MKARQDFDSKEKYIEYLRHYYAGQAMNGLLSNSTVMEALAENLTDKAAEETISIASEKTANNLINALNIKQ